MQAGNINEKKIRPWDKPKPNDFNANRISDKNNAFYTGKEWRTARAFQLRMTPWCEQCRKRGITTEAHMVDHIKPINEGGQKLNPDNLQSLCNSCHARKSGLESSIKKKARKGILPVQKEEIDYFKKYVTDRK